MNFIYKINAFLMLFIFAATGNAALKPESIASFNYSDILYQANNGRASKVNLINFNKQLFIFDTNKEGYREYRAEYDLMLNV